MKPFEWIQPETLADAVARLREPGAAAYAGGIDLLDRMKEGIDAPSRLVSLRRIPGFDTLAEQSGALVIGAGVTLARIGADPVVRKNYVALAEAASHAATPQVRAMATLGGNLVQRPRCWYFRSDLFACKKKGGTACFAHDGDNQHHAIFGNAVCAMVHPSSVATALVALDARVVIAGPGEKGATQGTIKTRELPVGELIVPPERDLAREVALAPGEVITAIHVPAPAAGARSAYIKQGAKRSFDWPIADVAVVLELDGGRVRRSSIVLGAAAPVPWRSRAAEEALAGRAIDKQVAAAAAAAAVAGAKPLANNQHKVPVFRAVIARTILAAAGKA